MVATSSYDCCRIFGAKLLFQPPIARFMEPPWGPSGAHRTQVGPMLAPWTLLSGQYFLLWVGCLGIYFSLNALIYAFILCIAILYCWRNNSTINFVLLLIQIIFQIHFSLKLPDFYHSQSSSIYFSSSRWPSEPPGTPGAQIKLARVSKIGF